MCGKVLILCVGSERRIEKFCKYLPLYGWEPFVVNLDSPLPRRGRGKLNLAFRSLFLEDSYLPWIAANVHRVMSIISNFQPGAVIASAPPYSVAMLGAYLGNRSGIPLVTDYRDPWSFNDCRRDPHRWLTLRREGLVDSASDIVLHVSKRIAAHYESLHGYDETKRVIVVPNGYDTSDMWGVRPMEYDKFTLASVGTLWPRGMRIFTKTYTGLCKQNHQFAGQSQFVVAGNMIASLMPGIKYVGTIPHNDALSVISGAHALLYEWEGQADLASRIYEYVAFGKRTLALVRPDGDVAEILRLTNAGEVMSSESDLSQRILELWGRWKEGVYRPAHKDLDAVWSYNYRSSVEILSKELEALT